MSETVALCPRCRRPLSLRASECVRCGYRFGQHPRPSTPFRAIAFVMALAAAAAVLLFLLYGQGSAPGGSLPAGQVVPPSAGAVAAAPPLPPTPPLSATTGLRPGPADPYNGGLTQSQTTPQYPQAAVASAPAVIPAPNGITQGVVVPPIPGSVAQAQAPPPPAGSSLFIERPGTSPIPTIHVDNQTGDAANGAASTLVLSDDQGHEFRLTLAAGQQGSIQVPPGHYSAALVSPDQTIGSAIGDGAFRRFRDYYATIIIEQRPVGSDPNRFHLGD